LRNTPEACLACLHKTECLRSALEGAGELKIREEFVDRAYASGRIRFWERWARKKDFQRKIKKNVNVKNKPYRSKSKIESFHDP